MCTASQNFLIFFFSLKPQEWHEHIHLIANKFAIILALCLPSGQSFRSVFATRTRWKKILYTEYIYRITKNLIYCTVWTYSTVYKLFCYKITFSDSIEQKSTCLLDFYSAPDWILLFPPSLSSSLSSRERGFAPCQSLPISHTWSCTTLSLSLNFSFFAHLYFPHQCLWISLSLMMMMTMWPWRDCDCSSGWSATGTQEHSGTHCCQATRWEPGSNKHELPFFLLPKHEHAHCHIVAHTYCHNNSSNKMLPFFIYTWQKDFKHQFKYEHVFIFQII